MKDSQAIHFQDVNQYWMYPQLRLLLIHVIHLLAGRMPNAIMDFAHVCQITLVILTNHVDQNVQEVRNVLEIKHASETNVVTHVREFVDKIQNVMLLTIFQHVLVQLAIPAIHLQIAILWQMTKRYQRTHVIHLLVVLIVFAGQQTIRLYVLALKVFKDRRHYVDQNVLLALSVLLQKLVLIRNVSTHVSMHVVYPLAVK